ncbi:hypothetical protein PLUA15_140007 [Pseudomonas lundensis]|uniref:Uncharacterized protein n=1 Tax=Pseudomonas lundensis TaxID=86185 RepID=A0AAX2H4P7_9PSED|nr:hypothetical protein PLUA15_140007 [Pseudomonas lundensis]
MRAAIIDAHHNRFVIAQIGDQDAAAERQLAMGGAEGVLIERFAAGSTFAMVAGAVIRGNAGFVIAARVYVVTGTTREQAQQGAGAE